MSTAELLFEAVDTAIAVHDAIVQWLIVLAVVGSILVLAAVACGAWGIRAAVDTLSARQTGEQPTEAPREPHDAHSAPRGPSQPARHTPAWAHTDHHQDAA